MKIKDTILCKDREDAKNYGDAIGWHNIIDWRFLISGEVILYLSISVKELSLIM